MKKRPEEYKPLLYTTTVRNPERVKYLLYIFEKFDGQLLTNELAVNIVAETIKYGLYRPMKRSSEISRKWKSTPLGTFAEEILTDEEVKYILTYNPQQHKEAGFNIGFASRFATIFDFTKELGFVYFAVNERIEFSELGHKLSKVYEVTITEDGLISTVLKHPEYEQYAFLQALAKSQRKNPFVRVLNDNIPLILLLETIIKLNANPQFATADGQSKGLSRRELPLLIFWKDNNAEMLYQRIVKLREDYKYEPSDEVICDICTNEIMGGFKQFKVKSIMEEYPDEFIRKMRITGLISLRGAGRFVDINYNEDEKIDYILKNYSHYKEYADERDYFNHMAEIDENLFLQPARVVTKSQSESLLENWVKEYSWGRIKEELICLYKRNASKDTVMKLLPAPVRLEFLTALSLKSKLPSVRVIPNYKCDDAGLPTSTAAGGLGDIECFEEAYGILVEVTMSEGRTQTMMEVWPIERHLKGFIENCQVESQAIFIAPTIYCDSIRQIEFVKSDNKLTIRPYKINDFIQYLEQAQRLYE